MISIIICSLHKEIGESLANNIRDTIGIEHEIVFIYNTKNKYSIFEAYNIGVSRAKYPICCFMHDDIIYHSNSWGTIVSKHFENDKQLGIVAVAGCKYLRKMPSFWAIPKYTHSTSFNLTKKIIVLHKYGIIYHSPRMSLLLMECGFVCENHYSTL